MKPKKFPQLLFSIALNGLVLILGLYFLDWDSSEILFVWTVELLCLAAIIGYLFDGTVGQMGNSKTKTGWAIACSMPAILLLMYVLDYTKSELSTLLISAWISVIMVLVQSFFFYKQQRQTSQTKMGILWLFYILAPVAGFIAILSLKEGAILLITLVIIVKMLIEIIVHYTLNKPH
ncbi:MAG: hypothetical protein GY810_26300 [Aureispira sp.]|nr:hypothetical protein [Aureispira sp.]